MSSRGLCLCLLSILIGTTAAATDCAVTTGPYNPALQVYKCPPCAYVVKINLRGGCWIDGLVSLLCSDGSTVNTPVGNPNGGGPISLASRRGFTEGHVGTANNDDGSEIAAAVLRLSFPYDGSYSFSVASAGGCRPYTTDVWSTVAKGTRGRIIGLQAQAGPNGVARIGFLAGNVTLRSVPGQKVRGGVSEFQYIKNNVLLLVKSNSPALSKGVLQNMTTCFFRSYARERARFNANAPHVVALTIDQDAGGVAATGGDNITVSASYINSNPYDYGLIAHEGMHVIQQYNKPNAVDTGYWTEGLADYARKLYGCNVPEGGWVLRPPVAGNYFKDGYGTTARFLLWLEKHVNAAIPTKLDSTIRGGAYTDAFWTTLTGRTMEQHWAAYVANPAL